MAESQNIEWKESRDVRRVRKIAQKSVDKMQVSATLQGMFELVLYN
jgi:hypothetical protein